MDEAVRSAEVELLGWTAEEVEKAQGQACLALEFGGHDMQPRTDDRYLLHLAAWLESMEDDDSAAAPDVMTRRRRLLFFSSSFLFSRCCTRGPCPCSVKFFAL